MRKYSWLLPILIVFVLSIFSWKALLSPGFFTMHDDQQIARLFELDKSLSFGQFPVRWVKDLGFGYGYPLFNFYPPLTYYLGEIFHLLIGTSFIDSTKLVWFVAFIGSAISMYFLSKEFFGKFGGVVSALFYLYAPYHAVDSYVRGAQAELFSFVWLPLILLFSYKSIKENSTQYPIWTGIILALLMITHNLVFLPFFGLFALWYFLVFLIYRHKNISFIIYHLSFIILLTFGLSAFFWLPALVERQYTLVDQLLIKNLASYKIHFVCLSQLWDSPWGFGGSVAGCVDGLSFKIGKLHVVLSIISLGAAGYFWLKKNHKIAAILLISNLLLLTSIFMTTEYSQFIWDHIPQLWYLQFPWRFLEFTAFFTSLLAGSIFLAIDQLRGDAMKTRYQLVLAGALIVLLLVGNTKLFNPQFFTPTATDDKLTSDQEIKWHVSSTSFEYLPKEVATKLTDQGALWVDIDQSKIAKTDFNVLSGSLQIKNPQISPDKFLVTTYVTVPAVLQMQITAFPGWRVWIDKTESAISDSNSYKLITINIPSGNHTIIGKFTDTPVRSLGNTISLVFLAALFLYGFRNGIRRSS